jgi:hypothetical protein
MSKLSITFISFIVVIVMLFDGKKNFCSSYVLLQVSVVICTVQLSVVFASVRASREHYTGLKLLDCNRW